MSKILILLSVLTIGTIATTSTQAASIKRNDPNRPVGSIAADLGISTNQFVTCFHNVNPASKGTKASRAREHANKDILLPCLQKANTSITNNRLDDVMDKYRPEGRVAGD
ncbi:MULTISPECIES: hypothetical protein [unclassified Lentilitoribacter]|jgi:hypothetical protein|uniref:hypothetical protein n=1 Tax=unclassified Lentilitoribacter TaxID=2647570 RepID=UPI0013A702EB|nr:hypothetical protein [Lentilitoribacter sp. Alg239-R112]